jgi:hypothetical protein
VGDVIAHDMPIPSILHDPIYEIRPLDIKDINFFHETIQTIKKAKREKGLVVLFDFVPGIEHDQHYRQGIATIDRLKTFLSERLAKFAVQLGCWFGNLTLDLVRQEDNVNRSIGKLGNAAELFLFGSEILLFVFAICLARNKKKSNCHYQDHNYRSLFHHDSLLPLGLLAP